jgi:hypothetical protein
VETLICLLEVNAALCRDDDALCIYAF